MVQAPVNQPQSRLNIGVKALATSLEVLMTRTFCMLSDLHCPSYVLLTDRFIIRCTSEVRALLRVSLWRCALPPWTHLCCDACCSPDTSAADAAVLSLYLPHAFPSSQCSVWSHWRVLHFSPAPYPLFLPIHGILYCNSLGVSMGVQYGHLFLSLPDFWAVLILLGSAR